MVSARLRRLCLILLGWVGSLPLAAQEVAPNPLAVSLDEKELRILLSLSPKTSLGPRPSLGNEFADSKVVADFGRLLFFDEGMSPSGTVSCATCHDPQKGWSNGERFGKGMGQTERHVPTVLNSAWFQWQFWDGRIDSLWAQALQPIEEPEEMGSSRLFVLHHIRKHPLLLDGWKKSFGEFPDLVDRSRFPAHGSPAHSAWNSMDVEDQELVNHAFSLVGKAIEAFERTLLSGPSPFDEFVAGLRAGDEAMVRRLSPAAQRGMKLFIGDAGCMSCHFSPRFSDGEFHNLGLKSPQGVVPSTARTEGIRALRLNPFNGRSAYAARSDWEANPHLLYLASNEHVVGAYKTPSLRNVARTAPYMHDGRFASLEEVLDFYSELPGDADVGHREETLLPLNLQANQEKDLVEFLKALSSPSLGIQSPFSERVSRSIEGGVQDDRP